MSTSISSEALDPRRRRALWRAWHRGTKEMDLVLGRFADAELPAMADADLAEFERLLEVPEHDLFAWVAGQAEVAANYDSALFRRLRGFHLR